MNPASIVLRWYRQAASDPNTRGDSYTPEEVLDLLRADPDVLSTPAEAARAEAVRGVAAVPSRWLGQLTRPRRRELGELADRLPAILFHHVVGRDLAELVQRFGGWGTWRYERALEIAAACIADHLNRSRLVA